MSSDVHGYIYPYSYANNKPERQGFGVLSHTIKRLRNENTIVIDNGDVLEGSPFVYYHFEQEADKPNPITDIMNEIHYDFFNLGNHDFNHGQDVLMEHIEKLDSKCLSANLIYKGEPLSKPYHLINIAGKTVALFGVVTHFIPNWEKPENISDFEFIDALDCAKDICKKIKEEGKADYVVGVYHGGFEKEPDTGIDLGGGVGENQGYEMCQQIDNLDILLTGHQHRSMKGVLFDTAYIQNYHQGTELSFVEIDTETGEITTEILKTDEEPDQKILDMTKDEEKRCQDWLDTPLGTTKIDLVIKDENDARLIKSQVVTFLNRVCTVVTGADISANAIFLFAKGFEKNITMRDLVATYVFPNTLVVKKITGKILREYLEKDAEFWAIRDGKIIVEPSRDFPTPQHHNYDMLDGVEYEIKVSNPIGMRITKLTRNGVPVKDDDVFTLCVNNYRAAGGGDFDMLKNAPTVKEIQRSVVELLGEYIEKEKVIDFEPVDNINVVI